MTNKYLIIGSDPEVFLKDSQGKTVSSLGIIPGDKHRPFKTQHGSVQPDNISAEFNSIPSATKEDFIKNHRLILSDLEGIIKPLDLSIDISPSVMANKSILTDPRSKKAGCEPDHNAWESCMNFPPALKGGLRAAGGHLHISFHQAELEGMEGVEVRQDFIKACDLILGVPSVIYDTDKRRKTLYGKAGATRLKFLSDFDPYNGAEYRTLSNFWLKSDELMGWVFDSVKIVHENLDDLSAICNLERDRIINIINSGNQAEAKRFMNNYHELYEGVI